MVKPFPSKTHIGNRPMAAWNWRVIRAFAERLKKSANPTSFGLFRFER
jgi:hypothetical protein